MDLSLCQSNHVHSLPHKQKPNTMTQAKLQPIRASQLSEQVSSSAMHWTLSEWRLSRPSSLTGQLTFGGQSTCVWAGSALVQRQHKSKTGINLMRKRCKGTHLTEVQFMYVQLCVFKPKRPFNKSFVLCVCFKKPLQIGIDEKTYFANITAKKFI